VETVLRLVQVPFVYSMQARYLAFHPVYLGPVGITGVLGAAAIGYYIFRAANGEKNDFRNGKNPNSTYSVFSIDRVAMSKLPMIFI